MSQHIFKCLNCRSYSLEDSCSGCGGKCVTPRPPKFSLEDKYADYRRITKLEELKKRNLY